MFQINIQLTSLSI